MRFSMKIFRTAVVCAISAAIVAPGLAIQSQTSTQKAESKTSTTKPKTEGQQPNDKETTPPKKKPLSPAEKRSYDLLVATLDQSDQIVDPDDRADIIAPAAMLLWKYDQQTSRDWIKRIVDSLFEAYERHDDRESRTKNVDAVKNVARAVAARDAMLSQDIIEKLDQLRQKYSEVKSNSAEYRRDRLDIAEEAIKTDPARATQIVSETVASGIPSSFPGFLYRLAESDPKQADALFRQTLTILASGSVYRLNDAITLSVYAFKETQLITPATGNSPDGRPSYGTLVYNAYKGTPAGLDVGIANEYLNAVNAYLRMLLGPSGPGIETDLLSLGRCFYLVNKSGYYATYFNPSSNDSWQQMKARVLELMKDANVEPGRLADQTAFAQRLSKGESPFKFDEGAADFERADKTTDKAERDKYLMRGIVALGDAQKFDEAEKKIQKITDTTLAGRLRDFIDLRAGEAAVRNSSWTELQNRAGHISDTITRVYLLLKGASAAVKPSKATAIELLNEATRLADKLDASASKTKLLIVASGIYYKSADTVRGGQVLAAVVRELNSATPFTSKQSFFTFEIQKNYGIGLLISDWDFDISIKEAASKDWEGALMLIGGIQLPKTRLSAQIAALQASPAPKITETKSSQTSNR